MPKKPKEVELDLQTSESPKKETFVTRWFKDACPDNPEDIKSICELTARSAEEQFKLELKGSNYEVFALVFFATFESVLDFLREKQKRHKKYSIEICNSINIGYQNSVDPDNEKMGNFMPVMEYVGVNRNIVNSSEMTPDTTTKSFILWKELNIKKRIEDYKEIQELAYDLILNKYNTDLRTSEAAIPLFCIFMDHINNVLRMKYREAEGTKVSEIKLRVMGIFDAFYSFNEETAKEVIQYTPLPFFKLGLKNDSVATG
jgi:hypothetical protein